MCQGPPQFNGRYQPNGWLPTELNWSGCQDVPIGMNEEHRGVLRDIDDNPLFSQPPP